jgi:hypothetical protein
MLVGSCQQIVSIYGGLHMQPIGISYTFVFSQWYIHIHMYTPTCMKLNTYMQSYIYNIPIHIYIYSPWYHTHTDTYIYIYIHTISYITFTHIYIYSHHIIYHIYPLKTASRPHWDSPSPGDELRSNLVRDAFEYLGLKAAPAWNDRRRLTARRLGGFCCGDLEGILAIRK